MDVEDEALLELAAVAAARATEILLDGLHTARTQIETKSTGTDMVTEIDRAAERSIVDTILAERPDDGLLGEEGARRDGTSGIRWIIDPLDGTTNYLYGHPGFNVSIAAERNGTVVAGIVSDPLNGDIFTAVLDQGARRNGAAISASTETRLGHALVATGFSYEPERRARQAGLLQQVIPQVRDIRRMGAAAVDLCSVACGRVDAYYERGLQPWDHAAGGLIASEAGAIVGDLRGGAADFEFTLAAPPALFESLRAILVEADAGSA